MNQSVTPETFQCSKNVFTKHTVFRQSSRLIIAAVLLASLVACPAAQTTPDEPEPVEVLEVDKGLASANALYKTRNYNSALVKFNSIISNDSSGANSRRLSHLGKALIYLSTDQQWHSIEKAKASLEAAGQVEPGVDEEFAVETDMFMNSVTALIGSESEIMEMKSRSNGSVAEISRLKKERSALTIERDELLEEQKALNEALEKLKNLTLGG